MIPGVPYKGPPEIKRVTVVYSILYGRSPVKASPQNTVFNPLSNYSFLHLSYTLTLFPIANLLRRLKSASPPHDAISRPPKDDYFPSGWKPPSDYDEPVLNDLY